jgi:hypothetical protein
MIGRSSFSSSSSSSFSSLFSSSSSRRSGRLVMLVFPKLDETVSAEDEEGNILSTCVGDNQDGSIDTDVWRLWTGKAPAPALPSPMLL